MKRAASRFWCQACAAYGADACAVVGHRSERLVLSPHPRRWQRHNPPIVLERAADGRLVEVKS